MSNAGWGTTREKIWTDEKLNWLIESAKIYDDREKILEAFNNNFKTNVSLGTLKGVIRYYHLKLPKCIKRIENNKENLKLGYLKLRGFIEKEIGEEIKYCNSSNRTYIKISNNKKRSEKYVEKHRYLYEQYHNIELTDNDVIVFLNGNKKDFRIENLQKISRPIHSSMTGNKLYSKNKMNNISRIKFIEWRYKLKEINDMINDQSKKGRK